MLRGTNGAPLKGFKQKSGLIWLVFYKLILAILLGVWNVSHALGFRHPSRQRSGLEIQIREPLIYTGGVACQGAEENE